MAIGPLSSSILGDIPSVSQDLEVNVGAGPRSYRKDAILEQQSQREIVPEAAEKRAQPLHLRQRR